MSLSRAPAPHGRTSRLPTDEPARWLLTDSRMAIRARIRGLWSEAECVEWIRFEANNRARPFVIKALNARIQALNADGGVQDGE